MFETPEEEARTRIARAGRDELTILDLNGLGLMQLPPEIGGLMHLRILWLGDNQLHSLPAEIGKLSQLQLLLLANNKLHELPGVIGKLEQLNTLWLENNRLPALPPAIGQLSNLRELRLENNELGALPLEMQRLGKLARLYLHGNSPLGLPEEILGPSMETVSRGATPASPATILDYYFRVQTAATPLNEVKLLLVGRGGAGKSSLVRRLVYGSFDLQEPDTPGITITPWPLTCANQNIHVNVWDFAGQEITHSTHQFFLTERSIYLLALTGREDFQDRDAEYWLRLIRSYGGNSPVLVALNKFANEPFSITENALRERHPNIAGFYHTDCATGAGIPELREAIKATICGMESVRAPFPRQWRKIKEQLSGMTQPYLGYKVYRDICSQSGEPNPIGQQSLAEVLHRLGIVLHYADDERLNDTTVLNPHWVTKGIYKILRSQPAGEEKGVLRLTDVKQALPAETPDMQRYLIELMRRFQLCFPLGDTGEDWLVPLWLPKDQPPLDEQWRGDTSALRLRYEYAILPGGLLPRFIVRTYPLSQARPRWREGVILASGGAEALVRAFVGKVDAVEVTLRGRTEDIRQLAGIIRESLGRIHADLKEPQPRELAELSAHPGLFASVSALERGEHEEAPVTLIIGDDEVQVDRRAELDRLSLREDRTAPQPVVRVFLSYVHKDERLKDELGLRLDLLQNRKKIQVWHDRRILPGQKWDEEIQKNLQAAHVVLFLVSQEFLNSEYTRGVEVAYALERASRREAIIVPIILRACPWQGEPWAENHALPQNARPVKDWSDRDHAWLDVHNGLEQLIDTFPR
jgi:internalin A